ncbi:MAG: zf-TFIIB domain-containing protein [Deltaproteobacteria bacterium]|nr:zf-TFIIB domain-containing protein [Deltaproteobacteria bacterium]
MHGVELERCPKDHGVWFDPDELQTGLMRASDPAQQSAPPDEANRTEWEPLGATDSPTSEPPRPIIEPSMLTPEGNRQVVPVPPIDDVVNMLMRGSEFRVGSDRYRWDVTQHRIVVEGTESRVVSDVELSRVVEAYPELFSGHQAKVAEVIARMKRGATFQNGYGRAFDSYGWDPQTKAFYKVSQEDSYESARSSLSESRLAELIAQDPRTFQ